MRPVLHRSSYFLCLLCLLSLFSGCDRRELTYYLESEIELYVDWSHSGLDREEEDYGATAIFYPQDGSEPKVILMGNRRRETIRLPEGRYNVLLFNRSFTDFGSLAFRGETYEKFEAYARRVETRIDEVSRTSTRVIVSSPEKLAAAAFEGFEVTEDMLGNYSDVAVGRNVVDTDDADAFTLRLLPEALTQEIHVQIHVKGLNNVRNMTCTLTDVSESVILSTGESSGTTVSQQFSLSDATFTDGSPFDGVMTGVFNTFGFDVDAPRQLALKALLVDGMTVVEESFDVTARQLADENGTITIYIEVTASPIPDVKPEGGSDSGFDVEVGEWGKEEDVDINT